MLQLLQKQLNEIFDISKATLLMESDQQPPDPAHITEINFGCETQLTAMRFSGGQRRRYLTYKVEYESGSPESLYYSVLPFDGPYHRHNVYELTYVVSGRLTYVMSGTEVNVNAGEALLMDLNCVHFDRNRAEDAVVLFLHITPELFHAFIEQAGERMTCSELLLSENDSAQRYLCYRPTGAAAWRRTEQLLAEMIRETGGKAYGSREMFALLACRLLQHLERNYTAQEQRMTSSLQKDLFLVELDQYIQEHLPTVSTRDIVQYFHFNSDYFGRKIRQKYGVTLTEYIQQKKMMWAQQMLVQTNLPVLEVITRVGYKNARYFYEIFKSNTGLTPAEYRERMTGV